MRFASRDDILKGNLLKTILLLSIPVMINQFLQSMYNLTDTYWLGQLGTEELAAINLVTHMQNLVTNLGGGITVAGSVLIAQYLGAKKDGEARKMANHIFVCTLLFAVFCAIVFSLLSPAICRWLGAEGNVYTYAKIYLELTMLDMPFLFMVNAYTAVRQAEGDTVSPVLLNLLGIVINLFADPLLMVHFHLGAAGAALATIFAKFVPAVIAFLLIRRKKQLVYVSLRGFRFEKEKLHLILTVGLPSAIGGSIQQLGFLMLMSSVYRYGDAATAAYGIGTKINSIITLPCGGVGSAVSILTSQNFGAGNLKRAEKGYRISALAVTVFLLTGGFILSRPFVSVPIVSVFSDEEDVIELASRFLGILAIWCVCNGVRECTAGFFKGMGKTLVNMIMDISRIWIFRFGILHYLEYVQGWEVESIWYAVVFSNAVTAVIMLLLYASGIWKKWKVPVKKNYV